MLPSAATDRDEESERAAMKALAILKDSLREAIDTKVFYVMVAMSSLLTLIAFTLSFKPGPPSDIVKGFLMFSMYSDTTDLRPEHFMGMMSSSNFTLYEIKSMEPLDGAPEGPKSPYRLNLVVHYKTAEEAAKTKASPAEVEQLIRQRMGKLDEMQLVTVTDIQLANASPAPTVPETPETPVKTYDVPFDVTIQPTPTAARLWPHEPSLFFGAVPMTFLEKAPLGAQLYILEDKVVGGFGAWISILISVIITSFFIPNMLRKGTVDLLLVKPIPRFALLLYKYLGGLTFIFLNTAVAVIGMWLALGLRSGVWAPSFLLTIFIITFFFAILYSFSTLFAVLTRSPIAAILLTLGAWFVLFLVGFLFQIVEEQRVMEERQNVTAGERFSEGTFAAVVRGAHFVVPRTKDLDILTSQLLIRDLLTSNQIKSQKLETARVDWGESLTVSFAYIAVLLGLSCWWFATRDY